MSLTVGLLQDEDTQDNESAQSVSPVVFSDFYFEDGFADNPHLELVDEDRELTDMLAVAARALHDDDPPPRIW